MLHSVGGIQSTQLVHQERPTHVGFLHVSQGERPGLKCYNQHLDVQGVDLIFMLSQLREMLAARQSAQMPMEHQQQPMSGVILQPMYRTAGILQRKLDCGFASAVVHRFRSQIFT